MLKLFQINTTYSWTSTGRIAVEIGQKVMEYGWKSYIAYGRYIIPGTSHAIKIGNKLDVYNHVLQTRLWDLHGLASKRATLQLIQKIKEVQPDIIHLHNIHGYYLNYPILFDFLASVDIPIVWTLHDCWTFTGHCAYYTYAKCERWKSGCHHCPQKKAYPATLFLDNSSFNYELKKKYFTRLKNLTLIPVSNWLKNELKQSFLKNYPIQVINNGIDLKIFKPSEPTYKSKNGLEGKYIVLGVASVWEDRKGLNDFISLNKVLSDKYQIILVGLSPKQIKALPDSIIGINRTNNIHELAELYATADVFVNPTWEDNFPTTNLEALACGTPVITYRTGGSIEAIDDQTGTIVNPGDIENLAKGIEKICNREDYREMSNSCRERAVRLYDKQQRYEAYYQLYLNLLKG